MGYPAPSAAPSHPVNWRQRIGSQVQNRDGDVTFRLSRAAIPSPSGGDSQTSHVAAADTCGNLGQWLHVKWRAVPTNGRGRLSEAPMHRGTDARPHTLALHLPTPSNTPPGCPTQQLSAAARVLIRPSTRREPSDPQSHHSSPCRTAWQAPPQFPTRRVSQDVLPRGGPAKAETTPSTCQTR